jgi:hypothetical protein
MTLTASINRIDTLLLILEICARAGFMKGTEPAKAMTEASKLRTEFTLIVQAVPDLTADSRNQLQNDLTPILSKLEQDIQNLLKPKRVTA